MNILVTGGAGYIGSHTSIELINAGYEVIIVDNLCNSNFIVVDRIQEITGKKVKFYKIDATNKEELKKVFVENKIDANLIRFPCRCKCRFLQRNIYLCEVNLG